LSNVEESTVISEKQSEANQDITKMIESLRMISKDMLNTEI